MCFAWGLYEAEGQAKSLCKPESIGYELDDTTYSFSERKLRQHKTKTYYTSDFPIKMYANSTYKTVRDTSKDDRI